MDEKSTYDQCNGEVLHSEMPEEGPSEQTLNYLKMFARSYYVESSLPKVLNALCLN
jgi:hypothetical protein